MGEGVVLGPVCLLENSTSDMGHVFTQGGVLLWLSPPQTWSGSRSGSEIQNCFCDFSQLPMGEGVHS